MINLTAKSTDLLINSTFTALRTHHEILLWRHLCHQRELFYCSSICSNELFTRFCTDLYSHRKNSQKCDLVPGHECFFSPGIFHSSHSRWLIEYFQEKITHLVMWRSAVTPFMFVDQRLHQMRCSKVSNKSMKKWPQWIRTNWNRWCSCTFPTAFSRCLLWQAGLTNKKYPPRRTSMH